MCVPGRALGPTLGVPVDASSLATLALLALALAAQPWSVLAGIVLVSTRGGVVKEVAYVIGWVAALTTVAVLTATLGADTPPATSSTVAGLVELGLGLVLLAVLALRWRRAPGAVRDPQPPGWLARLDAASWPFALVLGAFLPNYIVVVAAVNEMLQVGLAGGALVAVGLGFVALASLGVAAPLGVLLLRREGAADVYAGWRSWLLTHNRAVTYGTGALVASMLVVKGLSAVAA